MRRSDRSAPHLAMVESRRRFGPGAVAALLLIVSAAAFAIFYDSQSPNTPSNAAPANVGDGQQPTPRKADRAAINNSVVTNAKREANDREQAGRLVNEKKREATNSPRPSERINERKKEAVTAVRPAATKSQQSSNSGPSKPRRPVGAPALRLPNPDLGNNSSAPASESPTRSFGSSPSAPQFFRAADGTLTVKFSDGSTRVVKPGARTTRPD